MRIAISGTHFSGKSTLVDFLSQKLTAYEVFEEPYFILEEAGIEFSDPPAIEDFEEQMECSVDLVKNSPESSLFDRSPIDFLAYAMAISELTNEDFDQDYWVSQIEDALSSIDVIVFTPIETPDRIKVPGSEDKELRSLVDEKLRELVLEDSLGLLKKIKTLEVHGSLDDRVKMVLQFLDAN